MWPQPPVASSGGGSSSCVGTPLWEFPTKPGAVLLHIFDDGSLPLECQLDL